MKKFEFLIYVLGLEVSSNTNRYYIFQAKYASDLLTFTSLTKSKITSTPIEANIHLTCMNDMLLDDPMRYCQSIGSLIYLTVMQSNVAFVVHNVS